mmetsp:Transcript_71250/g.206620  ORF Transcript_71250/g.206620 Transcript_71250/m.206620 type:complete len:278 (+) Transcript_71250:459-1292(+)
MRNSYRGLMTMCRKARRPERHEMLSANISHRELPMARLTRRVWLRLFPRTDASSSTRKRPLALLDGASPELCLYSCDVCPGSLSRSDLHSGRSQRRRLSCPLASPPVSDREPSPHEEPERGRWRLRAGATGIGNPAPGMPITDRRTGAAASEICLIVRDGARTSAGFPSVGALAGVAAAPLLAPASRRAWLSAIAARRQLIECIAVRSSSASAAGSRIAGPAPSNGEWTVSCPTMACKLLIDWFKPASRPCADKTRDAVTPAAAAGAPPMPQGLVRG